MAFVVPRRVGHRATTVRALRSRFDPWLIGTTSPPASPPPTPPRARRPRLGRGHRRRGCVDRGRRCRSRPRWRTATGSSPAPPARARPRRCSSWPSSCRRIGVPVFAADVKGDLSGLAAARRRPTTGSSTRAGELGIEWSPAGYPGRRSCRSAASAPACRCGPRCRRSGPSCWPRCSAPTRPRRRRCRSCSATPTTRGLRAARPRRPARGAQVPRPATRARPSSRSIGGLSSATAGVLLR